MTLALPLAAGLIGLVLIVRIVLVATVPSRDRLRPAMLSRGLVTVVLVTAVLVAAVIAVGLVAKIVDGALGGIPRS